MKTPWRKKLPVWEQFVITEDAKFAECQVINRRIPAEVQIHELKECEDHVRVWDINNAHAKHFNRRIG